MKPSELLSALLLIIVVLLPLSLMFLAFLQMQRSEKRTHLSLLALETKRNQTLLNLIVSGNFQTFAGMQQITQTPSVSQTPSMSSASEYIPRDDITEAARLSELGKAWGVGEQLFEDDPELAEMLTDMAASGQIDLSEGG